MKLTLRLSIFLAVLAIVTADRRLKQLGDVTGTVRDTADRTTSTGRDAISGATDTVRDTTDRATSGVTDATSGVTDAISGDGGQSGGSQNGGGNGGNGNGNGGDLQPTIDGLGSIPDDQQDALNQALEGVDDEATREAAVNAVAAANQIEDDIDDLSEDVQSELEDQLQSLQADGLLQDLLDTLQEFLGGLLQRQRCNVLCLRLYLDLLSLIELDIPEDSAGNPEQCGVCLTI